MFIQRLSAYIVQHDSIKESKYPIIARNLKFLATKYLAPYDINHPDAPRFINYL